MTHLDIVFSFYTTRRVCRKGQRESLPQQLECCGWGSVRCPPHSQCSICKSNPTPIAESDADSTPKITPKQPPRCQTQVRHFCCDGHYPRTRIGIHHRRVSHHPSRLSPCPSRKHAASTAITSAGHGATRVSRRPATRRSR